MNSRSAVWIPLAALIAAAATGCATKNYVRTEVVTVEASVDDHMGTLETRKRDNQARLLEQEEQIAEVSLTAREALDRAVSAGKLAEGTFLFETVLTDEQVRFGLDRVELGADAMKALDAFAELVIARHENLFIEIQGHTDSVGSESHNLDLGERRADVIRRYLNRTHALALHRMSVVSYGESQPIASNSTEQGRAQNRRVALVVLK